MKGLVGGPLLVGNLRPGRLGPPLNPALRHPREDRREDVGVGVGAVECEL